MSRAETGIPEPLVSQGVPRPGFSLPDGWQCEAGAVVGSGVGTFLGDGFAAGPGEARVRARLRVTGLAGSAASLVIGDSHFGFCGARDELFVEGPLFGGETRTLGPASDVLTDGVPFEVEVLRADGLIRFRIDGRFVIAVRDPGGSLGPFGLRPWRATMHVTDFEVVGTVAETAFPTDDLFVSGTGGYHTYRIPALIVTPAGTALAFCEGRRGGRGDSGDIDLLVRRSEDGGITWGNPAVVWDDAGNTCGNPCPVVDPATGTIRLLLTWNRGDDREPEIINGTSTDTRRVFLTSSEDDGKTWSVPEEITARVKKPDWTWYATGPGNGIALRRGPHAGRLVVPCDHIEAGTKRYYSHVIVSDDGGRTWELGGRSPADAVNECAVAELDDGRLLLNMRNYDRRQSTRQVCFSDDGGMTWRDQAHVAELPEPICQASLIAADAPGVTRPVPLLFANPASAFDRRAMTLRLSRDDGRSWPLQFPIHAGSSAYSSLAMLPGAVVGCLFERDGYSRITLARIALAELDRQARPARVLTDVRAPEVVGIPPSDAFVGLSRTETGEIRHYDYGGQRDPGPRTMAVSRDRGLTWERRRLPDGFAGADVRSPVSGEYIRLETTKDGVNAVRSVGGLGGTWERTRVWPDPFIMLKPPVFVRDGTRILVGCHSAKRIGCGTFYSDDDGRTWQLSNLVQAPPHAPSGSHLGTRWNHGAVEPTVVELRDGRVWLLARTAQDELYESFSADGGQTWAPLCPSRFYGTITMPTLGRLDDGRLLLVWCNTTPLPERAGANGTWEDVFTNRDAAHAAISADEGLTWSGFREILLNPRRNDPDYAETGGVDRSVHQSQFLDVGDGRILVSLGQHPLHRSLVLFAADWLTETERSWTGADGLAPWSTHRYVDGIRGHCAYNRAPGARLVPHPDDPERRALAVGRNPDPTLVCENEGAVWNFPAGTAGRLDVVLRINPGFRGARISLTDRWFNPTDLTAGQFAMYNLEIGPNGEMPATGGGPLAPGQWVPLSFNWDDSRGGECRITIGNAPEAAVLPLNRPSVNGISYLHIISSASETDPAGLLVESVRASVTPPGKLTP